MARPARKPDDLDDCRVATTNELFAANINPHTGLATDYLNHFNDALMLLDIIRDMPDCAEDFMAWRPRTYVEHFDASHFDARDLVISTYENADSERRVIFDTLTGKMTAILVEVGQAMHAPQQDSSRARVAGQAAGQLRLLMIQAGSVINGEFADDHRQIDISMDVTR